MGFMVDADFVIREVLHAYFLETIERWYLRKVLRLPSQKETPRRECLFGPPHRQSTNDTPQHNPILNRNKHGE